MDRSKDYWFPAKRYGWGWGFPTSWQGWIVLLGFILLLVAGAILFPPHRDPFAFVIYTVLLCALLVAVCYFKGEPSGWRWGGK